MVYVLSKTGQPLMPTENHAKVRVLLKQQKAKIVHRCPFTIQLLYDSTDYTQPVSLGIDAGCISGHPDATSNGMVFYQKKVRCHNRQIHKQKILKGGIRKRNQAPYLVKGFRLFEKVKYHGKQYFIFGRRSSGFFDIRTLDGTKVNKGSVSCKKIRSLDMPSSYLTEERKAIV